MAAVSEAASRGLGVENENPVHSSSADPPPADSESSSAPTSTPQKPSTDPTDLPPQFRFRFTGVNQKGPIMGLLPPRPAPISVQVQKIDEDLLRESLAEETG